ncbi:hypothetical protein PS6_008097 [Mucor atramentarius]
MSLADIIDICRERNLPTEGKKSQLISDLLFWRDHTRPIPAPSTPRLGSLSDQQQDMNSFLLQQHQVERNLLNSTEFSQLFLDSDSSSNLSIPFSDLIYGKKIGSGGFKDCYEAYKEAKPTLLQAITKGQLRHENVIKFIGVCTHPSHLCIVTEICAKGDLFDVIRNYSRPSFAQQIMHMYDIALGVSYLHTRRPSIIHRDLKSMNILISKDDRAKINDFGLARIRPKANTLMHTQCGTPNWQAPEFWSSKPSYSEKVDISNCTSSKLLTHFLYLQVDVYACGLIFWEILTWGMYGYPYQNLAEHALYVAVKEHDIRPPISKLTHLYPRNLLVLIMEMWETDPSLRPSMTHVVERLSTYLL